ncbi:50S ribosomal protein L23 [Patescibacteria group bacterium]|nr:50S ribosomal protein L23 [Patescibacteria group bacterium]
MQDQDPDPKGVGKKPKKEAIKKDRPVLVVNKSQVVKAYQVIKEPHITEKATDSIEQNKYVFKVFPKANKSEIKKAIKALYGAEVEKVNIVHLAPKKRRIGKYQGWRKGLKKGYKKAIVTLKQGEEIEILPR